MSGTVVRARNIAKRAIKKERGINKSSKTVFNLQRKKLMRQHKRVLGAKKRLQAKKAKVDQKYFQMFFLLTVGLAIATIKFPQIGVLAIVIAILCVASYFESRVENLKEEAKKDAEGRMRPLLNLIEEQKNHISKLRFEKKNIEKTLVRERHFFNQELERTQTKLHQSLGDLTTSFAEFPYKSSKEA